VDIIRRVFADEQQVFELVFSDPSPQTEDSRKDDIVKEAEGRDHEESCRDLTREQLDLLILLVKAERSTEVRHSCLAQGACNWVQISSAFQQSCCAVSQSDGKRAAEPFRSYLLSLVLSVHVI
jgi:hypothetical protein